MRLQSAIFDMDGTLLDSMPTWRELGPTFLKEAGISATPEQDRMLHTLAMSALSDLWFPASAEVTIPRK